MKKIYILVTLFVVGASSLLQAQSYRIYFTDKGSSAKLINNPYLFLSPRAVAKRALRSIPVDHSDLPVAPEYIEALKDQGLKPEMCSRWFNYVKVEELANPEAIKQLPFVKKLEPVQKYKVNYAAKAVESIDTLQYGFAANQIEMVNGDYLHDKAYQGQGMSIAVLDGGFTGARNLPGLDSLWNSGRVKGTFNFVNNDTNIFVDGGHGTSVLSILAGYIEGQYAGSAILANYWLFKTEFEASETPSEMDNWLRAAERSDSLGVDVITSSLGYSKFDGGFGDYDYDDMDGNTTLVTRAADHAARKGILVVVSAGNEGSDAWQYITAPADGDSVLTVGAVQPDGTYASFSSTGPTYDGRIKPTVAAQGVAVAILTSGGVAFGSGTSFSCPIVSGLAACLWQVDSSQTNMQIYEAIRSNASQVFMPDYRLGFGIANFREASWDVSQPEQELKKLDIQVYPNPVGRNYSLEISGLDAPTSVNLNMYDIAGKLVYSQQVKIQNSLPVKLQAPEKSGTYLLNISLGERAYLKKIVK